MSTAPLQISTPEELEPVGRVLTALGVGLTLVDREMRVQWANGYIHEYAKELAFGRDHCFSALWRKESRCADCLPLLAFRTSGVHEGLRQRGRPGTPVDTWRVRAVPVLDASGTPAWVAECIIRLTPLASGLTGRAPAEAGGAAFLVVDGEERIVSWSVAAAAIFGYSVEQALGRRIDLIVPESRADEERTVAARVQAEGRVARFETERRARDGRLVPVALAAVALHDEAGRLMGRSCLIEDLSALQQLRGRIAAQEQLLTHITEEAADAIIGITLSGEVTSWNHGAEQLLGPSGAQMIGTPLSRVAPEPEMSRMLGQVRRHRTVRGLRMQWSDTRGEPVPVDVSAALLADPGGEPTGVALVARDLSAQQRLDRQLVRSEKLAVVGSLAVGLAHEIGTPLNVISATAEYLMLDVDGKTGASLQGIVAETERISRLVRELLSFSRPSTPGKTPIRLQDAVERVLSLLRYALERKRIHVERDTVEALPLVHADPDGLHQVLLNLLLNAVIAVPEGGHIGIRARNAQADAAEPAVAFEVHDDGPGVSPALRERIFDPFFTTRADGTGLGLAVCARIIAEHGGDIRVEKGPLGGAGFVVHLPAALPEESQ